MIGRCILISRQKGVFPVNMSIEVARKILEGSRQRANELRSPVSIAIVDAGGHLVLFERMMAPYGWATGSISIAKASTAVMFNQSTDAVAQWGAGIPGFASSMATMTQGKFIMAAGGWPIRIGGATIGGIGVSGGNAPGRDDEIARAGLAVVEGLAEVMPAAVPMSAARPSTAGVQAQQQRQSVQPTPSYGAAQLSQPQFANVPLQPNMPSVSRYLTPNQENPYSEETISDAGVQFRAPDENKGGQT